MSLLNAGPAARLQASGRMSLAAVATSIAVALVVGIAAAVAPMTALVVAVLLGGLAAFVMMPLWLFVPTAIVTAAGSSIGRLWLESAGAVNLAPLVGQGRVVAIVAGLLLIRALLARRTIVIPQRSVLVLAAFGGSLFVSAVVATVRGTADPDLWSVLQQEASYVIGGFAVGVIAMSGEFGRLRAFRALGVVTIVASLLSVLFWAWASGFIPVPGAIEAVFDVVRIQTAGGTSVRANFPFADMHNNTAAMLFAAMAGLSATPLFRSENGRDRALAGAVLLAAAAGVLSTQTRAGILLLGIASFFSVRAAMRTGTAGRLTTLALVGLIGAGLIYIAFNAFPEDRRLSTDATTLLLRESIWQDALAAFEDEPVFGHGLGYGSRFQFGDAGESVHNEYLQRLVDGGLVSFAALIFTLGTFAWMAWSLVRATAEADGGRSSARNAQALGMLTFVAIAAASMMAIATWTTGAVASILSWIVFGMLSACSSAGGTRASRRARGGRGPL